MKEIKFTCPMCDSDVRLPVNTGDIQYAGCEVCGCTSDVRLPVNTGDIQYAGCEVCGCTVGMDIDKDEFWLVTVFDSKGFKKNMGRIR